VRLVKGAWCFLCQRYVYPADLTNASRTLDSRYCVPSDADIRASSDRYLRNAIIAVLSSDPGCTLWDAARLLSVGEEGYAYRRAIGARVRALPELKEISAFFTSELSAQLADARYEIPSCALCPPGPASAGSGSPATRAIAIRIRASAQSVRTTSTWTSTADGARTSPTTCGGDV
jgi:hypothetical protein